MTEPALLAHAKPSDYYRHTRAEMLDFFPESPGRVLDVGSGDGRFGELLKRHFAGVEVWGIEPTVAAQASAARVLDRAILGLFNDELNLPEQHFDVVVFNDSLEHFPDHVPALLLAMRLLKPNGMIVASIPNVRYWPHVQHFIFDKDWRYEAAGILDRTHLRFFTRRSMLRDFEAVGFLVERIEGINPCWLGWKFKLLSTLMPKLMDDMPYQQFALRAIKPVMDR